ncbi:MULTISPECIES: hypothetical protein [unclassified Streptomyces]|uniref:hypothetical protein n=1 Tax=unclassified Streptomyces TaxID=2593676 RepID=UPI000D60794B|nr:MULTISPECIES: hypothetical protein [unclassified Streptomyces]MBJ6647140.1 hypothetical protein [Streptomyces sp. BSE7-9]PWE06616.1 hypothetical protein DD630_05830 [Streptomyces sp. BSE7F]
MSAASIARRVNYDFEDFTATTSTEEIRFSDQACLADYVEAWVRCGRGVRVCCGDFQTFMIALTAIIDDWIADSSILDYVKENPDPEESSEIVPRRVSSIFGKMGMSHRVLDPDFFATQTFHELHGRNGEDPPAGI